MALNSLLCAHVPLRNCSLTHPLDLSTVTICSLVWFELNEISTDSIQAPHLIPKADWLATYELFTSMTPEVGNHALINTHILLARVVEQKPLIHQRHERQYFR